MNEICYIKYNTEKKIYLEIFNVSIFDVLLLFNNDAKILINNFYSIDNYGTSIEKHYTEKNLGRETTVNDLYNFINERSVYGENFTVDKLNCDINNINIVISDDYQITISYQRSDIEILNTHLEKILRILKFVEIKKIIDLIKKNVGKYLVFDADGSYEVYNKYSDISKSLSFGGE